MKTANWIKEFSRIRKLGGFTRHGKVDWVAIKETIKRYIEEAFQKGHEDGWQSGYQQAKEDWEQGREQMRREIREKIEKLLERDLSYDEDTGTFYFEVQAVDWESKKVINNYDKFKDDLLKVLEEE